MKPIRLLFAAILVAAFNASAAQDCFHVAGDWEGTWSETDCENDDYGGNWDGTISNDCQFEGFSNFGTLTGTIDPLTGVLTASLQGEWCGDAEVTGTFQNDSASGSWTYSLGGGGSFEGERVIMIRDVVGTVDLNNDGWGDVAFLKNQGNLEVKYFSGANHLLIDSTNYLNSDWAGLALSRVSDTNGDGASTDPSVSVLAHNPGTGKHIVQTRRSDTGALVRNIFFLNDNWRVLDIAVVDDTNGDGVPSDPSIAVLAINPTTDRIVVQVRRLSDGGLIGNRYFLNTAWKPVALEAVNRMGPGPLLSVLAVNPITGKTVVQGRLLSDGSLHRNTYFLNTAWRGQDVAILRDTNGDATLDDPSYLLLATNPVTGKTVVQARRVSDGSFRKNIFFLNTSWRGVQILSTSDISGNSLEEVGVLAENPTTDNMVIQLKDYATTATTINIYP